MSPILRPLTGCVVNLSISESDDSVKRGFPGWQVNRTTLQIVAALFGQGASIVFGHDWRDDGVMEAVYGFARQVQPPIPLSQGDADAEAQPVLRNLLPWPSVARMSKEDQEQLTSTLRVETVGLPEELKTYDRDAEVAGFSSPLYTYIRARGLTFLRHRLTEVSHVRLCVGGAQSGAEGRYPGVVEEALLAVRNNKPLYLASFLGGATQQVVDAIEGNEMPDNFCRDTPLLGLYQQPPITRGVALRGEDSIIDRGATWREFAEIGRNRLAGTNGLTVEENDELFHSPVIERVVELVLIGLSRIWPTAANSRK